MLKNTKDITPDVLLAEASMMMPHGFRFVTLTCVDLGDTFDLIYHFDKDYELSNLRLKLAKDQELPSISHIYFAAVIVENEIKDLFGVKVTGMAIDYEGRFILAEGAPKTPQCKPCTPGVSMQIETKQGESK